MTTKKSKSQIEGQIKESNAFRGGKPEMTDEQLKAIDEFARKKSEFFDKVFDSPEKTEEIDALYRKALKKA